MRRRGTLLSGVNVAIATGLLLMPVVIGVGLWSERRHALPYTLADLRGSLDEEAAGVLPTLATDRMR